MPKQDKTEEKDGVAEVKKGMRILGWSMLLGLASVPVYALYSADRSQFLVAWSVGSLLCGGAMLTGVLLGFLFGIPRTRQREGGIVPDASGAPDATPGQDKPAEPPTASPQPAQASSVSYRANTNLEEISDWLTKILVGVGLTQIDAIQKGFAELTEQAAMGLGNQPHSQIYAAALIGFAIVPGFLYGYLWTRLYLASVMRDADQAALGALTQSVRQASREVEHIKRQSEHDAQARNLVDRQLNPIRDLPAVPPHALDAALKLASRPVRVNSFNKAYLVRHDNWRDHKDKMELSIPVFRALIHSDTENQFHRNHAQLGYALMDKEIPDWAEALAELSAAIKIRDERKEKGWLDYEFWRSICRIMNDGDYRQGKASAPHARQAILADLEAAMQDGRPRGLLTEAQREFAASPAQARKKQREAAILDWLKLNGLSAAQLLAGQ